MSNRFRHQLEDYRVVSFIEGKPVQLGGIGPTSISHVRIPTPQDLRKLVMAMVLTSVK
jgi:hypothetical protein